ncbi:RluA family pseudouridine synthase, partial [Patescibacteria group bacterium]|nr:RluA family pseudouridine synthase [Patescibacteria group bacterium]
PLKIVFEDRSILVIDKDAGMVVHPTADHPSGTLVNALLHHLKSIPESGETLRPGIVHRLDKGTSGLLVVAKTQEALDFLKKQFKERRVVKKYLALVRGKIEPPVGTIEKPIARHHKNRKKFAVSQEGKDSVTVYRVVDVLKELFSLVEVEPKTGRTHQIRVHLSSIGHPIVGDRLYGGKPAARMFLHASYLEFTHPQRRKKISFASKLPENLEVILQKSRA